MMKKLKLLGSVALAAFASLSMSANAAITSDVTITFGTSTTNPTLPASIFGQANVTPNADVCPTLGATVCWNEVGATVGTVYDPTDSGAHLHRTGPTTNRALQYHADSAGIYIRAFDGTAFSAKSLDFRAPEDETSNPDIGANQYWEILGFNTPYNPDLASGNGTDYATRVAYQQVLNGTDVTGLLLNSQFENISGLWIHYVGYPSSPAVMPVPKDFALVVDNIVLGAPVTAVPIPAAAWLFGSAMAGFLAIGRRKSSQANA